MPRLEVEGVDAFHVEGRKRVVLAIAEDAGRTSSTVSVQNHKTGHGVRVKSAFELC